MSDSVAMQTRCVHCLREQWAPAVYGVSVRGEPCAWCGESSEAMTVGEYAALIAERDRLRGLLQEISGAPVFYLDDKAGSVVCRASDTKDKASAALAACESHHEAQVLAMLVPVESEEK